MKINIEPLRRFLFTGTKLSLLAAVLPLCFCAAAPQAAAAADALFYLHDGDRVCFYGDSITEQRFYGVDVQTYVRTRFPHLRVSFVNSGVGGDKVTGGWAGQIDLRLQRDVFPFKPNVVTIMLGMNDAKYQSFNQEIFNTYTNGYEHLIESLQAHLPGVRIVLIAPSPYDDVTETPKFPGGYNEVLLKYSAFVHELAAAHDLMFVDFNEPLVAVMQKAFAQNPALSHEVIPGRVHPSAAGELVMAQALLQAWNAPSTVTAVTIDVVADKVERADNTRVSDVKADGGTVAWTQKDACLPFPILALHDDWPQFPPYENPRWGVMSFVWPEPNPNWDYTNPVMQMVLGDCGFYAAADEEPLQVKGLPASNYQLKINAQVVGEFTADQLAGGINLAECHTPMLEQSYRVLDQVWQQVQWRYFTWRQIQLRLSDDHDRAVRRATENLIHALQNQKDHLAEEQYAAAAPQPMHYELTPVGP